MKQLYNDFYTKYGVEIHANPLRFRTIADLCKTKVLDIGCGTGDLADYFKGEYVGFDISDIAIKLAQKTKRETAKFLELDATKVAQQNFQNFDTIVMAEFLEHIQDEGKLFKNIRKWATPNARIIISVPNGDRVPDKNHLREFTMPELRARFSPMGKVRFYNWVGAIDRILMTIDVGQKTENSISLSMIIKNEEVGLENAVLSCVEFIDNIVIAVDRSSTDKSWEIAKRYADTLKDYDWADDFSKARNFAKEGIKTKWILSLDGHEIVEEYKGIEKALTADVDNLIIQVNMEAGDSFYTNRIYRSHLNWENPIHNTIPMKTAVKFKGLTIKHNLSKGQSLIGQKIRTEQREEMMPRLLKKEYKENKDNTRAIFYLARWFFTKKQPKKALKYYKKFIRRSKIKGEIWHCCWEASVCANALSKHLLALKFLRIGNEAVPKRWETSKQMGLSYMGFFHWEKAIGHLTDSFCFNMGDYSHYPEKKNNPETWNQIGFCYYQMKKYSEAQIAWERCIEIDEDKARIKLNKKRIEWIDRGLVF